MKPTYKLSILLFTIITIIQPSIAFGQIRDTIVVPDNVNEDLIEDFIQNQQGDEEFDFNTLFEQLETYRRKPLNLNKATREELEELRLLTDQQVASLLNHRATAGELLAIQELQSVPGFDAQTLERVLPFVRVSGGVDDYNMPIHKMALKGNNELFLRFRTFLEDKKGYNVSDTGQNRYLGDPNTYYVRFRHQYENRLSYGITAEKDPGEEFFKGSNAKTGFDFLSAHFYLYKYNKFIQSLALGDYSVNMGQGLIIYQGFGSGKGSATTSIRRGGRPINKYSSLLEYEFNRGIGGTFNLTDRIELTTFASYRKRDGNIGFAKDSVSNNIQDPTELENPDSEQFDELTTSPEEYNYYSEPDLSALPSSGLHRTASEIAKKHTINQLSGGGTIKYKGNRWHIAANALYNKLDKPLLPSDQLYRKYVFSGDRLLNTSLDYSLTHQNFNFFGETAISDNGGFATMNGLLVGADRTTTFALVHRYYSKDYQAFNPNGFGEGGNTNNEHGLYVGVEAKPNNNWIVNSYFDFFKHDWLKFRVDAPSQGMDYLTRITYFQKRKMKIYGQFRQRHKQRNAADNLTPTDFLADTKQTNILFQFENKINKFLELRNRLAFSRFDNGTGKISKGYLVYQDVIYKPMAPLHVSARIALFETDDYDSRIYAYENDILNSFSVPPYYNRGTRFYVALRYRGIRGLVAEARFAQTYYNNVQTIGTGLEEIKGQVRSEVKLQLKYQFGKYDYETFDGGSDEFVPVDGF